MGPQALPAVFHLLQQEGGYLTPPLAGDGGVGLQLTLGATGTAEQVGRREAGEDELSGGLKQEIANAATLNIKKSVSPANFGIGADKPSLTFPLNTMNISRDSTQDSDRHVTRTPATPSGQVRPAPVPHGKTESEPGKAKLKGPQVLMRQPVRFEISAVDEKGAYGARTVDGNLYYWVAEETPQTTTEPTETPQPTTAVTETTQPTTQPTTPPVETPHTTPESTPGPPATTVPVDLPTQAPTPVPTQNQTQSQNQSQTPAPVELSEQPVDVVEPPVVVENPAQVTIDISEPELVETPPRMSSRTPKRRPRTRLPARRPNSRSPARRYRRTTPRRGSPPSIPRTPRAVPSRARTSPPRAKRTGHERQSSESSRGRTIERRGRVRAAGAHRRRAGRRTAGRPQGGGAGEAGRVRRAGGGRNARFDRYGAAPRSPAGARRNHARDGRRAHGQGR